MSTFKKYMEIIQEGKTKDEEIELDSIKEEEEDAIGKIRNMKNGDVIYVVKNNKNKRIFAISKNATGYSISNVNLTNRLFIANSLEDLLDRIKEIRKKPKAKEDISMMGYPTEGEALENKFRAIRRKMELEVKTGRKMF